MFDMHGKYTFIDLFAGIGGFHLAFHRTGARCVFASECNTHARRTYEDNFRAIEPSLFKNGNFAGDITKVNECTIPDFDILTGGFPCQPFSNAGFKRGFADQRGTLFHDIVRIMKEKQPKAFFLENVSHLLKHDDGKTFTVIKNTIEQELGYSFYYDVIRASDFNLPQHRKRLFMVGFRDTHTSFTFPKPIQRTMTMSDVWNTPCSRDIGFTLRVGGRGSNIHDRRNWDAYLVDGEVRRLSPKEGKKMMGFPDDFVFNVSEAQAMKQLGNSVAVNAVQAVAESIIYSLSNYDNREQRRMERVLRFSKNPVGREVVCCQ